MKKTLYLILIFITNISFAQKQRFVYEITHIKNNKNFTQYFNLDIDKQYSVFYEDDIDTKEEEKIGTELIIKKDRSKNLIYLYEEINKKKLYYTAKQNFEWKISKETIKINDFTCQKAETNFASRKWIVYFTTQIPINDGPYKFYDLPGLIVRAETEDKEFKINLSEVKSLDNKGYQIDDSQFKEIEKKEFIRQKKLKDYRSNIIDEYKNHVMTDNGRKLLQEYIDYSIDNNVLIDIEK